MNENISRLMDGECDEAEIEALCGELKRPDAFATWSCYHAIGDALRGQRAEVTGFCARFSARIAQEPTVAAISVVGWTALSVADDIPAVLAQARQSGALRPAQLRMANVPTDYLLAHQEYSPATAIQGVGPYLRAVAVPGADARP